MLTHTLTCGSLATWRISTQSDLVFIFFATKEALIKEQWCVGQTVMVLVIMEYIENQVMVFKWKY